MAIKLFEHFGYRKLFKFTLPSIIMMIFTSIYGVVDGLTSAIISFLRTLVFQILAILLMPLVWGIDGIWASIVVAEVMAFLSTVLFIAIKKGKYNY